MSAIPIRVRFVRGHDNMGNIDGESRWGLVARYGQESSTPVGVRAVTVCGLVAVCPWCGAESGGIYFRGLGLPGYNEWDWNGSTESPTLAPSVLFDPAKGGCGCHIFVRDGQIVDAGTVPHGPKVAQ